MCHHFGIGVRDKDIASICQLLTEIGIVFDDTVVHYGKRAVGGNMRMGIQVVGGAVGSPAGVADAHSCLGTLALQERLEIGELAGGFDYIEPACFDNGDSGRIITTIFQHSQFGEEHRCSLIAA